MAKEVDIGKFVKDTSYTKGETDNKLEEKADADHPHDNATQSTNGFISSADKKKLDGIATGANKYTHPSYTSKSNGLYKITVDSLGHVSGTSNVSGSDLPSHSHSTTNVSDATAYNNIGTAKDATQAAINNGINTKLGTKANADDVYTKSNTMTTQEITNAIAQGVSNLELLKIVTALPQSNIDTNKIYLVTDTITGDKDLYVYVNSSWEQLDSLDFHTEDYYDKTTIDTYLSGKEDNINRASSITNDSKKYPSNAAVYSALKGKINTSAIKNDLETGGETNVLSAEQGKTLKSMIEDITYTDNETATDHNHNNIYYTESEIDNIINPFKQRYDGVTYNTSGNATITQPYARLFHIDTGSGSSNSSRLIFEMIHKRDGGTTVGGYVKCSVFLRSGNSTPIITILDADKYMNLNNLYFAFYKEENGQMLVDVFYKMGNATAVIVKVCDDHLREGTYEQLSPIKNGTETYIKINDGEQAEKAGYILYGHDYTDVLNPVYEIQADSFKKNGGTPSQFLKADGSVDNSSYLTTETASSTLLTKLEASTTYQPKTISGAASQNVVTKANGEITTEPKITNTSQLTNDGDGTNVFVKNDDSRLIDARTPTSHTHSDTDINLQGKAMANNISPIDMSFSGEFSANRLAYLPGENITIEYSTDTGENWIPYGNTSAQSMALVTTSQSFKAGKGGTATTNNQNQLRITINAGGGNGVASDVYITTRKMLIYYASNSATGTKVKIEYSTYDTPTTWEEIGIYTIGGNSGWNSYPINLPQAYGGTASQATGTRVQNIRLTFTSQNTKNFNVSKIRLYGEKCYIAPSDLAQDNHIYNYDMNKNTSFPNKIISEGFATSTGQSSQFLKADGSVDENDYLTTGTALSTYLTKIDASTTYQPQGDYLTSHNPIDTALSSTSTNAVQNKVINSALSEKAPTSHASTATTYGVATTDNYGHTKVIQNLTTNDGNGLALGAGQGKTLKSLIDTSLPQLSTITDKGDLNNANDHGWCKINYNSTNYTISNLPSQITTTFYGILEIKKYTDNYIVQTLYTSPINKTDIQIFFRKKAGGTWDTTWKEICTPTDGSVTNTKVASNAAIDFSKLNITKNDITGLGIPASDTNTTYTAGTNLSLSGTKFNHATSGVGAKSSGLYKTTIDAQGHITAATAVTIQNNLTTTTAGSVLDATQGKALKTAIDEKSTVSVSPTKTSGIEIGKITVDGTTQTLYQQDNNTTYSAGNGLKLSGTTFSLKSTMITGTGSNTLAEAALEPGEYLVKYLHKFTDTPAPTNIQYGVLQIKYYSANTVAQVLYTLNATEGTEKIYYRVRYSSSTLTDYNSWQEVATTKPTEPTPWTEITNITTNPPNRMFAQQMWYNKLTGMVELNIITPERSSSTIGQNKWAYVSSLVGQSNDPSIPDSEQNSPAASVSKYVPFANVYTKGQIISGATNKFPVTVLLDKKGNIFVFNDSGVAPTTNVRVKCYMTYRCNIDRTDLNT